MLLGSTFCFKNQGGYYLFINFCFNILEDENTTCMTPAQGCVCVCQYNYAIHLLDKSKAQPNIYISTHAYIILV